MKSDTIAAISTAMGGSGIGIIRISGDEAISVVDRIYHSKDNKKNLVFICNFTPVCREDYRFGMNEKKRLKLVLDSDEEQYGGGGIKHAKTYTPKEGLCDGKPWYVEYTLPAYGVAVFQY